jgi:hypothetical protein
MDELEKQGRNDISTLYISSGSCSLPCLAYGWLLGLSLGS